jgi:multidrug efflux pump subunit AcrB
MNLVVFAMRRPIAVVMLIVALIGGGILAFHQMRVDIFPAINVPQIYVVSNYAGMDPSQIEGIVTNVYEQNFQYVEGLKAVESCSPEPDSRWGRWPRQIESRKAAARWAASARGPDSTG